MAAGQAAEQIIAGVVLSERLAVTMYGAIHRAQFGGQRNLRGLVVDPRMLEEDAFRVALTDAKNIAKLTTLEHPNIVPTMTVEAGGPDIVIVTRGVGRYVTVQDLIASAKARSKQGGKLSIPVAGLIGKSVIEALAAAHRAGVIHGAVHPRSVLIGEDGSVLLADFIAGLALTTAVAQGADSSLWRGLTGYIAPELVVGEDPTPGIDVFAVGAMLFTMLSGEVPPGALRVTPAVERLVQRSLDTDSSRRYRTASDMLENLLEAFEDDRWSLADRGELIKEAGLSASDENIDDATEDLLASLGKSAVQVTAPPKEHLDAISPKSNGPNTGQRRLDALLADLGDDNTGLTEVDAIPRDSAAIQSRTSSASSGCRARACRRSTIPTTTRRRCRRRAAARPPTTKRPRSLRSMISRVAQVEAEARRAQVQAEGRRGQAGQEACGQRAAEQKPAPRVAPIVDPIRDDDMPAVKLRSPVKSAIAGLVVIGIIVGAGYLVYSKYNEDKAKEAAAKLDREKQEQEKDARRGEAARRTGRLGLDRHHGDRAGIWLRLGRTPLDTTIRLPATQPHDMVLLHAGNEVTEAQVNGTHWTGAKESLKGKISVTMKPSKAKEPPVLPLQPTTAVLASTGVIGSGSVRVESTPPDAEVWLFIGANHARFNELIAGRDYELAVVKPGFKTQHVTFKADDWRDGGDPNMPIDVAKKKPMLSQTVELEPDPDYKPPKKGK